MQAACRSQRFVVVGLLVVLAQSLAVSAAQATVLDMRNLVSTHPNLIHHYTFEGDTTPQRQADSKGTNNLVTHSVGTGSAASIAYLPGYDGTTTAMRPHYINLNNGAALQTSAGVSLPGAGFTVEMLVAPGATSGTSPGYAMSGGSFPTRAYVLLQREGDLKVASGGAAFSDGAALRDVTSTYSNDNWYYVAVKMQNSGPDTLVNAYVANLTAGDTSLFHSLNNVTISGNFSTAAGLLGIGKFHNSVEPFNGLIDEIAIYNTLLSEATLIAHFESLLPTPLPPAPEPSTLSLLVLGTVVAARRRRNRAKVAAAR